MKFLSKYLITVLFFTFLSLTVRAQVVQSLDSAYIKVAYRYTHIRKPPRPRPLTDNLILSVGYRTSAFFSPITLEIDSLFASQEGEELFMKRFSDAFDKGIILSKKFSSYIFKNYPHEGTTTVTDAISSDAYIYEDSLHDQQWQMTDSIKSILNYQCQMATCQYRGRSWTAWFCPDIPISNGPWLLGGLPGLILEAYDAEDLYHFTAVGMENISNTPIVIIRNPNMKGYVQTTRVDFLKAKERYTLNPMATIEAQTGLKLGEDHPNTESYEPIELVE